MLEAIALGLGCGLALCLTIGPVFFSLIQTSIEKGVKAGMLMAVGIMLSDSLYILITYLGISSLTLDKILKVGLGYVGGMIMLIFGVTTFLKKPFQKASHTDSPGDLPNQKLIRYLLKGFALNGINPFVFIYWIGISSAVHLESSFTTAEFVVYFISIVLVVFGTDLIKVFLANRLGKYITDRFQNILNKLVGTSLAGFGIYLIIITILDKV